MEFHGLRLWARMISAGQHDDYDEPPQELPFYGSERKKPKRDSLEDALKGAATAVCKMLSPSENPSDKSSSSQVNLRMKNYEQLRYLNSLYQDGILELCEYNEQKENIMGTLRQLKD